VIGVEPKAIEQHSRLLDVGLGTHMGSFRPRSGGLIAGGRAPREARSSER
jgi:hypothetical protein